MQLFDYNLVYKEIKRQDEKWGEQNHSPYIWLAILVEEIGGVAKAVLENKPDEIYTELIQVIAVCMQMYWSLQRQEK
jgi:NTP pyrophosphatase (non-canonical NTP hydrolase)